MPRPSYRSRTKKRIYVRTPGGRVVIHYEKGKINPPRCAICGRILNGFPRMTRRESRKGHRPPGRPYAGCICHKCLTEALKNAVREYYLELIR